MTELLPWPPVRADWHPGWLVGTIIFGAVIGVLARLVLPGKQNISMLITSSSASWAP